MTDPVKELADVVIDWHAAKKKMFKDILDTPSDRPLKIKMDSDAEIELDGEKQKGFRAGLAVALAILGELPFTVEDPCDDDPDWNEDDEPEPMPEGPKPEGFGTFG